MVEFDEQVSTCDRALLSRGPVQAGQFTISQGDSPEKELTVEVRGELDGATARSLWSVLETVVAAPARRVVVDLSAVEFMDCSSLRPLRMAARSLRLAGRDLVLRSPSAPVRRLLDITGVADEFTFDAPARTQAG